MARTGGMRGLGSDEAVWTKLIHLARFKIYTWDFLHLKIFQFIYHHHKPWTRSEICSKITEMVHVQCMSKYRYALVAGGPV